MKNNISAFLILLIVIFFSLDSYQSFAKDYNIDSLVQVLESSKGLEKIPYYYVITDYYSYYSPDKAIRFANEFLVLGEKCDSTEIIEYSYQILGESYFLQEKFDNALNYFNKFLDTQVSKNDEKGIGRAYNNLGIVYRALEDYPRAIQCYEKSIEIYLKYNDI